MNSPDHLQPPVKDRVVTSPDEQEEADEVESADGDEQRAVSAEGRNFHYAYHQQWPEMPSNASSLASPEGGWLIDILTLIFRNSYLLCFSLIQY